MSLLGIKKWLGVAIEDKILLDVVIAAKKNSDVSTCLHLEFPITPNVDLFPLNCWIQIELETGFKNASDTLCLSPSKTMQIQIFPERSLVLAYFNRASLLGTETLLAVASKERTPRSDGVTSPPKTAHISAKKRRTKTVDITSERAEADD